MALSIKSPEADRLADELARLTGETKTAVVIASMREQLAREKRKRQNNGAALAEVQAIIDHFSSLPILDTRSEDEILGYDENGIPS
jgi:antitoxin VapB